MSSSTLKAKQDNNGMYAEPPITRFSNGASTAAAGLCQTLFGFSAGTMRRRQLVLIALACVIASIFVMPFLIRDARRRQFDAAKRIVESNGGRLSFDLVDGNYILDLSGDAAADATIQTLMPTLKDLPTGFTLLGPGESRQFWLNIEGESLADAGLDSLCELEISWMTLSGGSITDISAARLSSADELHGIILNDVKLSELAVAALRASKPNAMIDINGVSE